MIYNQQAYLKEMNTFISKVFLLMSGALMVTAITAYYCAVSGLLEALLKISVWSLFFILIAQIALVIVIAQFLDKLSPPVALTLFGIYAICTGITFSSLFMIYTTSSIALTFVITSCMFASMAVYGYMTRTDLTGMGNLLFMALIGIIISMFANMFFQSASFNYLISGAAVIIFTLLTAYDVQKLKMLGQYAYAEPAALTKFVVMGALTLYLDFINLFLNLINFTGRRR